MLKKSPRPIVMERLSSLLIIMLIATAITKAMILASSGFRKMTHTIQTNWAMLLSSLYLIIEGSGNWSPNKNLINKKI